MAQGGLAFREVAAGNYIITVTAGEKKATLKSQLTFTAGVARTESLLMREDGSLVLVPAPSRAGEAPGAAQLSGTQVSALPHNKRDFSQLLLLATGTQTDSNGAANFTQQFTVNGQRGTATFFSMDGLDTTDPELGGATFSNFNVDAIEAIESTNPIPARPRIGSHDGALPGVQAEAPSSGQ